jgi:hypothetical protein
MTININIHAAEWEFKEELPFHITTVNDEVKDFELPLFDDDDNETERILLKDCRVIELIGEDDSFIVVVENALLKEDKVSDVDGDKRIFDFVFHPDKPLWNEGEDIGIFYSYENLPDDLKEIKIGKK